MRKRVDIDSRLRAVVRKLKRMRQSQLNRAAQARWAKTRALVDDISERSKALEARATRAKRKNAKKKEKADAS